MHGRNGVELEEFCPKKGANPKIMGTFYKTIIQSVLLYGSESWVISNHMMRALRSFHWRCAQYITGKHIWQDSNGNWHYPCCKEYWKWQDCKKLKFTSLNKEKQ
jgi:hypothetical protein